MTTIFAVLLLSGDMRRPATQRATVIEIGPCRHDKRSRTVGGGLRVVDEIDGDPLPIEWARRRCRAMNEAKE